MPKSSDILDRVLVTGPDPVREFVIQLTDRGIGIDDNNIRSDQFTLLQEGVELLENVNYLWRYNSSTGEVTFVAPTEFATDRRYEIRVNNTPADPSNSNDIDGVRDLAGNYLLANQPPHDHLLAQPPPVLQRVQPKHHLRYRQQVPL